MRLSATKLSSIHQYRGFGEQLYDAAGQIPSLDLNFATRKSLTDAVTGASLVTFTRGYSGTYTDSAGVLQTAATDVPRFDHNPTTGESLGLLVEEQRSNLLLNSGTLSTQSVTVTAVAHTLSFTGTGTITLTGTSTAGPLVGTGTGESNRVTLTFTPTAGSLTLTVSGTVTNAQLEAGAFRTSYIPTTAAAVTRSADVASIGSSAFTSFYNQSEGTVFADFRLNGIASQSKVVNADAGAGFANSVDIYCISGIPRFDVWESSTAQAQLSPLPNSSIGVNTDSKTTGAYKLNDFAATRTGGTLITDASGIIPTTSRLVIGNQSSGNFLNGTIKRLCYWPQRLANSTLQALSQ